MRTQKEVEQWFKKNRLQAVDLLRVAHLINNRVNTKALDVTWVYVDDKLQVCSKIERTFGEFYDWWISSEKPENLTTDTLDELERALGDLYDKLDKIHSFLKDKYILQGVDELFQKVQDVIADAPVLKKEPNYYPVPERVVESEDEKLSGEELLEKDKDMIWFLVHRIYKGASTETEYLCDVAKLHSKLSYIYCHEPPAITAVTESDCTPVMTMTKLQKKFHDMIIAAMDEVEAQGGAKWEDPTPNPLLDDVADIIKKLKDKTKTIFPTHIDNSIYYDSSWVSGAKYALHLIEELIKKHGYHDV